jgi:hypothetical protein
MDWQNQYCENGSTTAINVQIQHNHHKNCNVVLHRNRKKINSKIYVEAQKSPDNQSNPEEKEQCWRYHNTALQIILESHSNRTSMG